MSIKIGPTSQPVPRIPVAVTYYPVGVDENSLGPETLGLNITDKSAKTGNINIGLTPTADTIVPSINVGTAGVPNTFTGQLRKYSGGATISRQ